MTYRIFVFTFLISCFSLKAQLDCQETFTMKVTAKSGLNMRELPNASSEVITTIPYDNILIACASTSGKLVVGNTSGFWRQVSYEGTLGYVFDAYLELVNPALRKSVSTERKTNKIVPPKEKNNQNTVNQKEKEDRGKTTSEEPKAKANEAVSAEKHEEPPVKESTQDYSLLLEAYNFCGAVEDIDPGILWYAFYPADSEKGESDMQVKPVELEIVLSKSRSSKGLEFDIRTDRKERSLFMIGSTRPIDMSKMDLEDRSELMRYSNQKIFPGQQINLESKAGITSISATGGISSTGDCPELEDYRLIVKSGNSINLMELLPKGQCGLPEIYWFGDLNGDGVPDFIVVSIFENRNVFSLLVSQRNPLMRKAAEWTIEKCKN